MLKCAVQQRTSADEHSEAARNPQSGLGGPVGVIFLGEVADSGADRYSPSFHSCSLWNRGTVQSDSSLHKQENQCPQLLRQILLEKLIRVRTLSSIYARRLMNRVS